MTWFRKDDLSVGRSRRATVASRARIERSHELIDDTRAILARGPSRFGSDAAAVPEEERLARLDRLAAEREQREIDRETERSSLS